MPGRPPGLLLALWIGGIVPLGPGCAGSRLDPVETPPPPRDLGASTLRFEVEYTQAEDPRRAAAFAALARDPWLETIADDLSGVWLSDETVTLRLEECGGAAGVRWNAADRRLSVCFELVQLIGRNLADTDRMMAGLFGFLLLHEVGHALIDLLRLPVEGSEEDFADRFAVMTLLQANPKGAISALGPEAWGALLAGAPSDATLHFASEHALGIWRAQTILCWIYGSNAGLFHELWSRRLIPQRRIRRCSVEYRQMSRSFARLMAPWNAGAR